MFKIKKFVLGLFVIAILNASIAIASDNTDKPIAPLKQTYSQKIKKSIELNETGKAEKIDEKILDKIPVDTVVRKPLMPIISKMFKSLLAVVVLVLIIAGALKFFLTLKKNVSVDESNKLNTEPSSITEAVSSFVKNNLD